jgi:glycosyltransferase involved in cell wall biosynthesis
MSSAQTWNPGPLPPVTGRGEARVDGKDPALGARLFRQFSDSKQAPDGKHGGEAVGWRMRIAFIGNALPRRCGIATFTTDLELAVSTLPDIAATSILAMRDPGGDYQWLPSVGLSIDQNDAGQYLAAADFINARGFDVACLQHEFGIYGGDAGCHVLGLIAALKVPLVTTLHTVLDQPSAAQRVVMNAILAASAQVIVMACKGREILIETYGADPEKITVIPHGIPEAPFETSDRAKLKLGFAGRKVILTFGLISPSKGIETMIEAMPAIIASAPDAVYVVMGATHPHLLRDAGEAYRESLIARVRALGIEDHVVFINRFVDRPELLEHIAACDIYVTPYLVAAQMTSGTLAYSHGQGRPVVSTPYWHAAELLDDGSGVLVPFGDPLAMGRAVAALLADEPARLAMGRKAYAASRASVWAQTAKRYAECFSHACRRDGARQIAHSNRNPALYALPQRPILLISDGSEANCIAMRQAPPPLQGDVR